MSSDEIIVKWKADDGGWRQGVLMCVLDDERGGEYESDAMKWWIACDQKPGGWESHIAIIYDRTRNERAIVPLTAVSLVEPRCPKCGGDGVVDAVVTTGSAGTAYRCKTSCECQQTKGS